MKSVNAYGKEHDGNKVFVGVVEDSKQSTDGHTTAKDKNGNVYVTFREGYFDKGLASGGGGPDASAHWFPGKGANQIEAIYWNSSWAPADRATERAKAVKQVLQAPKADGGYGLTEPKKK